MLEKVGPLITVPQPREECMPFICMPKKYYNLCFLWQYSDPEPSLLICDTGNWDFPHSASTYWALRSKPQRNSTMKKYKPYIKL